MFIASHFFLHDVHHATQFLKLGRHLSFCLSLLHRLRDECHHDAFLLARIHAIDAGEGARAPHGWYTIDGRRLDGMPTAKSLYIHGGKKVVVK